MPPLSSHSAGYGEDALEIEHHLVHLNTEHYHHHTFIESINALLHVGSRNNSHPGTENGLTYSTAEDEISEDVLIVLFTLVPLIIVVAVIFLIAVAIRKMRRSESLQEVVRRNEFKIPTNKSNKSLKATLSSPLESISFSKWKSSKKAPSSPIFLHEIQVIPASSRRVPKSLETQLSLESCASSSSSNSTCSQSNLSGAFFSQVPPWYLNSTSYYKSQYHLNKLQLSYGIGSLQSFHYSMNNLNKCNGYECSSNPNLDRMTTRSNTSDSENDTPTDKKNKNKKLKKMFQIINFPKKIRQHQAEKNRFYIYTIPNETREQLKQIYVY